MSYRFHSFLLFMILNQLVYYLHVVQHTRLQNNIDMYLL